jgi:hypothetical protein
MIMKPSIASSSGYLATVGSSAKDVTQDINHQLQGEEDELAKDPDERGDERRHAQDTCQHDDDKEGAHHVILHKTLLANPEITDRKAFSLPRSF